MNLWSLAVAHLKHYPTFLGLNYNWSFGSLTGMFLTIQLMSGVFLSFHYMAEIDYAFESVDYIMSEVNNGWMMKYVHSNSASFFFVFMYLHMFSSIFYKSYLSPHHKVWSSGVVLLMVSMVVAFMGYVLPWGQMSYWGATVITNLVTAMPIVGQDLTIWLWGGHTVNKATLTSFYSLHYMLAMVLVLLVIVHLNYLHEVGSSNPMGIIVYKENDQFNSGFGYKDLNALMFVMMMFVYVTFFHPDWLGHPDNYMKADPLSTPAHIVPEWYFLPFYAVLSSIESKFWGVVGMLTSILMLLVLPFCHSMVKNSELSGGTQMENHIFFYLFSVSIIMLWSIGGLPAEYPFIQFGKFFTFLYFFSYVVNLVVSMWENRNTMRLFGISAVLGVEQFNDKESSSVEFKESKKNKI